MPATLKETEVDVLIIGAGPAGLMAAQALKRFGVDVRIIDKRLPKQPAGQADGIQPLTIEVFQSYGLADRLLKEANQIHVAAFYNPGPDGGLERTGRASNVLAPRARYPYEVTLAQGAIEQILLDEVRALGVTIEQPVTPTSLECSSDPAELASPHSHPVKVVLKKLNSVQEGQGDSEIVHAKYVLGADGAHSWVRKVLNIAMEGEQTEYVWGVLDMVPDTDFPDIRNRSLVHSKNGSSMVIPREGDLVRLYLQLTGDQLPLGEDGRVSKEKMTAERLLAVAKDTFIPYRMEADGEIPWWTLYIIGQRVASKFSHKDRIFIAGDACHTHSPKAGQGMNASMNDTHNWSWKLAQVLRGWANPSLLTTYEFERRTFARDLINFDRDFAGLFSSKPKTSETDSGVTHEEFLEAFKTYGGLSSGIDVRYGSSLLIRSDNQDLASNIVVGRRLPPHTFIRAADSQPYEIQDYLVSDARFKLFVFSGDISNPAQAAKVNALADDLAKEDSWFRRFTPARPVSLDKQRRWGNGGDAYSVFDVISVSAGKKDVVSYTDFPEILRPHWSKVLLDDTDILDRVGGNGYETYGVGADGAIVVVRPDGYVSAIAPLANGVNSLEGYFSGILRSQV